MTHAEICPVCNGNGMIYLPPLSGSTSAVGTSISCHSCGGKGWVEVTDVKPALDDDSLELEMKWRGTTEIAEQNRGIDG